MISIRYQILVTVLILVVGSLVTYLGFATQYITKDKLAYVYDLNSSLAHTRAQEVRARLGTLRGQLTLVASTHRSTAGSATEAGFASLLESRNDLVAIEIFERRESGFERTLQLADSAALVRLGLQLEGLHSAHQEAGIVPESATLERFSVHNTSVAPNAPLLTIALSDPEREWLVVADIDPSGLVRILGESTLYTVCLVDAQGNVLAHPDREVTVSRKNLSGRPSIRSALATASSRGVHDVDGGQLISAYSRLDLGRIVLVTEVARSEAMRSATELRTRSIVFGIMAMLVTLVVAIAVSRRLARPLRALERAAAAIGSGDLGVQAEVRSRNEIGALARSFNAMSTELARRDEEVKRAYASLQKADRLALIGAVTAGVTHELRNPLTYVLATADWLQEFVEGLPKDAPACSYTPEELHEAHQSLKDLQTGLDQIHTVVADLGRTSANRTKNELLDVRTVMEDAAKMASHQLKGRATIEKDYEPIPKIRGNASRLGQVFLNLLVNAAQVLPRSRARTNRVWLRTFTRTGGWVVAEVRDNGPGIPPDAVDHIFEQFFTTKEDDGGSGLGLAISRSIVEALRGTMELENVPGEGVTFRVVLPVEGIETKSVNTEPTAHANAEP